MQDYLASHRDMREVTFIPEQVIDDGERNFILSSNVQEISSDLLERITQQCCTSVHKSKQQNVIISQLTPSINQDLTYDRERRSVAANVIKNTDRLHNLLAKRRLLVKILRQHIVSLLNRCSLFKQRLAFDASGYAHAYVQQGKPGKHQVLLRKRLPNVKVQSTQNESYLYQFLSSEKQTLLLFKETEGQRPTESRHFHGFSLPVGDVINKAGAYCCLYPAVFIKQFNRYGVTRQQKRVVRPDGYIADVVYSA
jgi:hypothetical protein